MLFQGMGVESKDKIVYQCIKGKKYEQGLTMGIGCIPIFWLN